MTHNFDYQNIWDTFTKAASPVIAEAAFDSIRESLKTGNEVTITLSEHRRLRFSAIEDFEQWVQDTFYDTD